MSVPRRRVLRPVQSPTHDAHRHGQLLKRRSRLQTEQASLSRWMSRLKRAFHAIERLQLKITHLEREISRLDQV